MVDVLLWTTREGALGKSGSLEDWVAARATKEGTETLRDLSEILRRLSPHLLTDPVQEVPSNLQLIKNKLLKIWQLKKRSRVPVVLSNYLLSRKKLRNQR